MSECRTSPLDWRVIDINRFTLTCLPCFLLKYLKCFTLSVTRIRLFTIIAASIFLLIYWDISLETEKWHLGFQGRESGIFL